jgi:hypothetical protein
MAGSVLFVSGRIDAYFAGLAKMAAKSDGDQVMKRRQVYRTRAQKHERPADGRAFG